MITRHPGLPLILIGCALILGCRESDAPDASDAANATTPTAAESSAPAPTRPKAKAADRLTPEDPTVATFAGLEGPKPATWKWYPPENNMRAANYVVPAASGANQAHIVIFQGIGGGLDRNLTRWQGQFQSPDGAPVTPTLTDLEGTLDGVLVELEGEHKRTGAPDFVPNQLFLAAMIDRPEGFIQIILSGQTETVEMHRDAFLEFIETLRPVPESDDRAALATFPDDWFFMDQRTRAGRHPMPASLEGRAAPALALDRWHGPALDPDTDLDGKIVVVDFWATWCAPCRAAIPKNVQLADKYRERGVMFLGVHDSKSGYQTMPALADRLRINYPLAVDVQTRSERAWKVAFWPTYAVIDRSGTVRAAGLKPQYVERVIQALLDEESAAG